MGNLRGSWLHYNVSDYLPAYCTLASVLCAPFRQFLCRFFRRGLRVGRIAFAYGNAGSRF